ncbi:hypothetical protein LTR95_003346 [Oleoguttula sp. CCFEE 5521]
MSAYSTSHVYNADVAMAARTHLAPGTADMNAAGAAPVYTASRPSPPPSPTNNPEPGQPASAKFYERPVLPPDVPEMSEEDAVAGIMNFGSGSRMPPPHHTGQPLRPEATTVGPRNTPVGLGTLRGVDSLLPPARPTLTRKLDFGREDQGKVNTSAEMEDDDADVDVKFPPKPASGFGSSSASLPRRSIEGDAISPTTRRASSLRNAFANRGTQERASDHGVAVTVREVDPSSEHVEDIAAVGGPEDEDVDMADAPAPFQEMMGQRSIFPTQSYGQAPPPTRLMSDPTDVDDDVLMLQRSGASTLSRDIMGQKTAFRPDSRGKAPSSTGLMSNPIDVDDDMPMLERFPKLSSTSRPPTRGKMTGPFVFTEEDLDDLIPDRAVAGSIDGLAEARAEDTSMTDAPSLPPPSPRPGHRQLPAIPPGLNPDRHDSAIPVDRMGPPPRRMPAKLANRFAKSSEAKAEPQWRVDAARVPILTTQSQQRNEPGEGEASSPPSVSPHDSVHPSLKKRYDLSLPAILAERRAKKQAPREAEEGVAECAEPAQQTALDETKAFERSHRFLEWRIQASHIAHFKAFRRAIRKFWDTNQREDIRYTALALWIDCEPTPTMMKYVWGSEITDNVHLLFHVTDSSDLTGNFKQPRKVYGQVLGEGWDEAVETYWREREGDVERRRRYRSLRKEYPDLDLSFYLSSRKDSLDMLAEGAEVRAEKMGKEVYVVAEDDEGWSSSEDEDEEDGEEREEEGAEETNDPALQEAIRLSLSTEQ